VPVPVADDDLDLDVVIGAAGGQVAVPQSELAEGTTDVLVATRSGEPHRGAGACRRVAEDPRHSGGRVLGVERFGHDAGSGQRLALRMVLVSGENRSCVQRLPGLPGEDARRNARARDQQDETHRQVAELGAGLDSPPEAGGATTVVVLGSQTP
jgi:hypothetical protein